MHSNTRVTHRQIEQIYREQAKRVQATLIRLLKGNFDLAEEALQEAFIAALSQWPDEGVPANPRAWLVSAGRFKAIDRLRRMTRADASHAELAHELEALGLSEYRDEEPGAIEDDRLRLILTCCHPGLSEEARLALTLREVCDLTTEAIAAAFLIPVPTLAQRIVRAKNKIRDAGIPYEIPAQEDLPARLDSVLGVVYLIFNEGYSSVGEAQSSLAGEAIRLGQLLYNLLPETEVAGLLALMLLQDSRRTARISTRGQLVSLEKQDRQLWDGEQIQEGCQLVEAALRSGRPGPYSLQAAIAAVHARTADAAATDWREISGLYDVLMAVSPSPVVELNRAVALAMRDGPATGIEQIEGILGRGELRDYHLAYAALADLSRRDGRVDAATTNFEKALKLARSDADRQFLRRQLRELKKS